MIMSAISLQQRFSNKPSVRRFTAVSKRSERWAVILAGGDGTRLRSMTRVIAGDDRPKQFVPVIGGRTLLDQTRERVALSAPVQRTLFVLTETHQGFYQNLMKTSSKDLLVVQPRNKGTAPAILFALLKIATRSPKATVAFFPSDHYFANDESFMAHVDAAYDAVRKQPELVTLLGIVPDTAEAEYGWIEPHTSILSSMPGSITRVERFWEKPTGSLARELMQRGCLWNSFVMVGRVDALIKMTREALPELFAAFARTVPMFRGALESNALCDLYARISDANFSHDVLAKRPSDLAVMRVGDVGWSDLGDPARVLATLAQIGVRTELAATAS